MSFALNPKLLEKPIVPAIKEVVVPNPEAKNLNLTFVDIDKLNEAMSNAQRVINESAQAFRSYYEHQEGTDKKEIAKVVDKFEEFKQVLNQIWQIVGKDADKRAEFYDTGIAAHNAVVRELAKA